MLELCPEITLKQHQIDGVDWMLQRRNLVLADAVGLGKSISVLALVSTLDCGGGLPSTDQDPLCRVLVLTEASLVPQLVAEIRRTLPTAVVVAQGDQLLRDSSKQREAFQAQRAEGIDFLVLGHEKATGATQMKILREHRFAVLVVDEASKTKNGGAFAQAIRELAQRSDRVIAMTATPIENSGMDLWELLNAINADIEPTREHFREAIVWDEGLSWSGPKALQWAPDLLHLVQELVDQYVLRRTPEELGLDLPVRVGETELWTPPTRVQRWLYDHPKGWNEQQRFQSQKASILDLSEGSTQIDALLRILMDGCPDEQAIVKAENHSTVDEIVRQLKYAGVSHHDIRGTTKKDARTDAAAGHRSGDVRVLVGTSVLARGWDLQHCRRLFTVGDSPYNPAVVEQYEGRVRRIGSPHLSYEHLTIGADLPLFRSQLNVRNRKAQFAQDVGLG